MKTHMKVVLEGLSIYTVTLLLLFGPSVGQATVCTWGGSTNGDWFDATKWVGTVAPVSDGDAAVITNGSVILTNSTPGLSSFIISNATLTFSNNWNTELLASNVTVAGTLTHAVNLTTTTNASGQWIPTNRVYVVCTNFTLASNGTIDASAKGYQGNTNWASSVRTGYGPGGGHGEAGKMRGGGGSYGGLGGLGDNTGYGPVYDTPNAPANPGSGGGCKTASDGLGGNGGGCVLIQASGHVLVNGTINANGNNGTSDSGGGGSGGGVWISCSTFNGTNGLITANGGAGLGGYGGGGGGGRIAVTYDPASETAAGLQPTVRLSANGGGGAGNGSLGTLYFTDTLVLPTVMLGWNGRPSFPSATNWVPNSLTLSNGWLTLPSGFLLYVTNNMQLIASRLDMTNSTLSCGGNLTLTNASKLYLYSGPTNASGRSYGGLLDVSGHDIMINSNCTLYCASEPTNGGSLLIRMQNLSISSGGAINGDGLGFTGGTSAHSTGYGPGGGSGGASVRGGGGGHGGKGGNGSSAVNGGPTNDVMTAPMLPGSGGANGWGGICNGGAGGSLVRVEAAGQIILNGRISADGGGGIEDSGGGGAGGGLYLICQKFNGATNGVLSAKGGTGTAYGGGGGGGRIAVWMVYSNYVGSVNVNGGTGVTTGGVGTVYWKVIPQAGMVISIN